MQLEEPVANTEKPKIEPITNHRILHTALLTVLLFSVFGLGIGVGYFLPKNDDQVLPLTAKKEVKVSLTPATTVTMTPTLSPTPTIQSTATPSTDQYAGWKTYTNSRYRFTLKYPQNWKAIELLDKNCATRAVDAPPGTCTTTSLVSGNGTKFSIEATTEEDGGIIGEYGIDPEFMVLNTLRLKLNKITVEREHYGKNNVVYAVTVNKDALVSYPSVTIAIYGGSRNFTEAKPILKTDLDSFDLVLKSFNAI